MARRPARSATRTRRPVRRDTVAWTDMFAKLFSVIVPADFTPPTRVRLVLGVSTGTWSGMFTDPQGMEVRAFVRLKGIGSKAGPYVSEKGLQFSFRTKGRAT